MVWQRLALLVVAAGMMLLLVMRGRHDGYRSVMTAFSVAKQPMGWVQVTGSVRYGGTYPLYDNKMTISAIKMAKPLCMVDNDAAAMVGNLPVDRGWVIDIQCLSAQKHGLVVISPLPAAQRLVLGLPLLLNDSTLEELQLVPGIGPHLAERIVGYRQKYGDFKNLEELKQVDGIADKKLEKLRPYLTI